MMQNSSKVHVNENVEDKPPYYVELLGRHHEVKARYRFEHLPITIGRGYENDLILDDPVAAIYHAIVERTEAGLNIRELVSQHGVVHQGKRVSTLALDGNRIVKLGHTNVRVRSAAFNIQHEVVDKTLYALDGWLPALAGLMLLALLSLISIWLNSAEKFSMINYLLATALVFGIVLLWSGFWAFACRMVSGHGRLGRHLLIAASAFVLIDFWDAISATFAYAFYLEFLSAYGNHVAMAIVAGMIYFHLTSISDQHRKRFVGICVALTMIGSSLILLNNYQRSGKLADELYMTHLLPPALRQSGNQTIEQFIQEARPLKEKLDKQRSEPVDNSAGLLGGGV